LDFHPSWANLINPAYEVRIDAINYQWNLIGFEKIPPLPVA
jgi:hypothetical protein